MCIFETIEARLSELSPTINKNFNEPASNELLAEFERLLSCKLPECLKVLYQWKNGFKEDEICNLFYGFDFHSINKAIASQKKLLVSLDSRNYRYVEASIHTEGDLIKVFEIGNDGGNCYLCINLSMQETGGVFIDNEVLLVDSEHRVILKVNNSVEDMLEQFASDLEQGNYKLNIEALEDGIPILEPAVQIDFCNWFNIERYRNI